VGVTLASYVAPVTVWKVFWVVIAFTAARFAAMGFNRIVDRDVDALNPRTKLREIPSGALSVTAAGTAVTVACIVFVVAAWQLNPLCLALSPVALGWVLFYSYTKRFTRFCHLVLGIGLSIAPVGGYLAVTGSGAIHGGCSFCLQLLSRRGLADSTFSMRCRTSISILRTDFTRFPPRSVSGTH
jgi:4-hydroxybenzoate polyprenyltransferase